MGYRLFLPRQTRIFLLKPAIEGGYVYPNNTRTHGLGDFLADACQKSFSRTKHPLTTEEIEYYRTGKPTCSVNLKTVAVQRFIQLYEMFIGANPRTPYFAITDVLNSIALNHIKLTNNTWPSKIDATHIPSRWIPPTYKHIDPVRLRDIDLHDAASYSISNISYESLLQMAHQDGYVLRSALGVYGRGLASYLDTLSFSTFIDTRPPADYDSLPIKYQWSNGFPRVTHSLTIGRDCLSRYVEIAKSFHIYPTLKYTETAITSSVLEAIGCKFLTPVQRPTLNLQHGPTLTTNTKDN